MSRSRSYCFTLNNYSEEEYSAILAHPCKYLIVGKETGENLTPHLQGYIYLINQTTLTALKACNGFGRAHLEQTKGSIDQNIEYCSKQGSFVEIGTRPMSQLKKGEAEQERYHSARLLATEGKLEEIDSDIYIRHYNTLKHIAKDHMHKPADLDYLCGTWIYGAAGVGKSRKAREDFPNAYDKLCNKWWDGYQDQTNVIIDDFDPNHACLAHHLKRWADRYSFVAEVKGGAMNIRPKQIVVTSQYSIEECFPDETTRQAIRRRFKVIHLPSMFTPQPIPSFVASFIPPNPPRGASPFTDNDSVSIMSEEYIPTSPPGLYRSHTINPINLLSDGNDGNDVDIDLIDMLINDLV